MSILIFVFKDWSPKSRDVRRAGLRVDAPALPPLLLPAPPPFPTWPGLQLPWGTSDHPWLRGGNTGPVDQAEAPARRLCPPPRWGWRVGSSPLPLIPGLAMGLAVASSLLSS